MQEVLNKLEQVQELDLQIDSIRRKKAEFPKRLSEYDTQISAYTQKHDEKKKVVDELDRNRKQQLGALELNEERIKRSQEKLEQVKNNQEYQAVLKEIESLKKNNGVIQENADKIGSEIETHQKELNEIEAARNEVQAKRDAEAEKISGEEKGFDSELEKLEGRRQEAATGINKRYLAVYDKIRMSKFGIGIVPAVAGSCRGCNMKIPPQMYNELQRGNDIHFCPSCRRILVYKDASMEKESTQAPQL